MYRAAQTGLAQLEQNPEKQRKYADFIDFYADLNEDEVGVYRMRYLVGKGEETIGKILDTERLRRIKEAIKVSREVQDVEKMIWH